MHENAVALRNDREHVHIKSIDLGVRSKQVCTPKAAARNEDRHSGKHAAGLGHTDVAYVLMNGEIWFKVPETMLFKIEGNKPDHIMAKDIILRIIGDIGTDGAEQVALSVIGEILAVRSGRRPMSLRERRAPIHANVNV